jgi:hypothetical protein
MKLSNYRFGPKFQIKFNFLRGSLEGHVSRIEGRLGICTNLEEKSKLIRELNDLGDNYLKNLINAAFESEDNEAKRYVDDLLATLNSKLCEAMDQLKNERELRNKN